MATTTIATTTTGNTNEEASTHLSATNAKDTKHLIRKEDTSTNEYVLNVAFMTFFFFVIVQGVFAVIAKSEAMMADCLAMGVDALTYLFNLFAERLKNNPPVLGNTHNLSTIELTRRRKEMRLYLEFIPPVISVMTLVIVSVQVMNDAINTIIEAQRPPIMASSVIGVTTSGSQEQTTTGGEIDDEPNMPLMFLFSALNLLLDVINVTCFAKAKNFSFLAALGSGFGINLQKQEDDLEDVDINDVELNMETDYLLPKTGSDNTRISTYHENGSEGSLASTSDSDEGGLSVGGGQSVTSTNNSQIISTYQNDTLVEMGDGISEGSADDDSDISVALSVKSKNSLNLNMCSAYTHVIADTLRSIAEVTAAALACAFKSIDASIADASAAIVVSFIIAISLGPLIMGLIKTWRELMELRRERAMEKQDEAMKNTSSCSGHCCQHS